MIDGLGAYSAGHFDAGTLQSGSDAPVRIRTHVLREGLATLSLWHAPLSPLTGGMAVDLYAGCDKSFSACGVKFANTLNFRGFPAMPGDDFALSYPASADGNLDGRSLQS